MGHRRQRPEQLPLKLKTIRCRLLGLTQGELAQRFHSSASQISDYETGRREPNLLMLLQYGRAAEVAIETLIDDQMDLTISLSLYWRGPRS